MRSPPQDGHLPAQKCSAKSEKDKKNKQIAIP